MTTVFSFYLLYWSGDFHLCEGFLLFFKIFVFFFYFFSIFANFNSKIKYKFKICLGWMKFSFKISPENMQ